MKEVFEKAILTYGQTAQEDVAIEEMSELIKAICKMRRAGVNEKPAATDAIVDEIADVSIMLEQLCMMYECFDAVEIADNTKCAGWKTGSRRHRHARNNHSFRKGCGNCIDAVLPCCCVGVSGGWWTI